MNKLEKLELKYFELGKEIEKLKTTNKKWFKILAPKWTESDGKVSAFSIIYIREDKLKTINGYKIIVEYENSNELFNLNTCKY